MFAAVILIIKAMANGNPMVNGIIGQPWIRRTDKAISGTLKVGLYPLITAALTLGEERDQRIPPDN